MLNALVLKHTRARVIPSCFEDAEDLAEGYDLVAAMDVPILGRGPAQAARKVAPYHDFA